MLYFAVIYQLYALTAILSDILLWVIFLVILRGILSVILRVIFYSISCVCHLNITLQQLHFHVSGYDRGPFGFSSYGKKFTKMSIYTGMGKNKIKIECVDMFGVWFLIVSDPDGIETCSESQYFASQLNIIVHNV